MKEFFLIMNLTIASLLFSISIHAQQCSNSSYLNLDYNIDYLRVGDSLVINWTTDCPDDTVSLSLRNLSAFQNVILFENLLNTGSYSFYLDPSTNYLFSNGISDSFIFYIEDNDQQAYNYGIDTFIISNQANMTHVITNHSTCLQNGEVTFQLNNTANGSNITYLVLNQMDTITAFIDTTGTTFDTISGLFPGDYEILGIEANSNFIDTFISNFIIFDSYEEIGYTITIEHPLCIDDGKIIINPLSGNGLSYKISGPINFEYQSLNLFENLIAGVYQVFIKDSCGNIEQVTITLSEIPNEISFVISNQGVEVGTECDSIVYGISLFATLPNQLKYPLQLYYFVINPNTNDTITISRIIQDGDPQSLLHYKIEIPHFGIGVPFLVDVQVIDNCGNDTIKHSPAVIPNRTSGIWQYTDSCGWNMEIWNAFTHLPITVDFVQAPIGFNPLDYNIQYPPIFNSNIIPYANPDTSMPSGLYIINIISACDDTFQINQNLNNLSFNYNVQITPDCGANLGSCILNFNYNIDSVYHFTPSGLNDITNCIKINYPKFLSIDNLESGNHSFLIKSICGIYDTINVNIPSYMSRLDSIHITPKCGSFDLYFDFDHNHTDLAYYNNGLYYLQYQDETGFWRNLDGSIYTKPAILNGSYSPPQIHNRVVKTNIFAEGKFRIIKLAALPITGGLIYEHKVCEEVIDTFIYDNNNFIFDSLYSFYCSDNQNGISSYSVFAEVSGIEPLKYKITEKDQMPFLVDNANNPEFNNLEAGFYKFLVEDFCGNELIRNIETTNIDNPIIQSESICDGTLGKLFTSFYPFMNYEWHKAGSNDILSTSHELIFDPFTSSINNGEYILNLNYIEESSCLNQTLQYTIFGDSTTINSGSDLEWIICDTLGELNLFNYLSINANSSGVWYYNNSPLPHEQAQNFITNDLSYGDNFFLYIMTGYCNQSDTSIIVFVLDSCNVPCIEFTGKLKLNTQIGASPGFKILVLNPDNTIGSIDVGVLSFVENSSQQSQAKNIINNSTDEMLKILLEDRRYLIEKIQKHELKITELEKEFSVSKEIKK